MPKLIDLTGKTFGRLTVLYRAENNSNNGHVKWVCSCSCGNSKLIEVNGTHLRNGHTQSCGCLQKEKARELNFIDMTGEQFGKITVLRNVGSNKNGNALWECQCECGSKIIIPGIELRRRGPRSCGCTKSKGEEKISKILTENNIFFEKQKTFPTCLFPDTQKNAKFDFFINNEYLIEYDGIQHFNSEISFSGISEEFINLTKRDEYKNNWCENYNIPLIRIPYTHYDLLSLDDLLLDKTKYRVI